MEKFWNRIYYSIFLFECNASFFFRGIFKFISPFRRIKFFRQALEIRGSSFEEIDKAVIKVLNNPEYGKSSMIAGKQMGGLLIVVEYSLLNFLEAITGKDLVPIVSESPTHFLIFILGLMGIQGVINYYLLWKDDKYLTYFKKFNKESQDVKRTWGWISLGVIVGLILLFIFSFWVLEKATH